MTRIRLLPSSRDHRHLPDELAARLSATAARRGVGIDELAAELVSAGLTPEAGDPLEEFIGCGASGRREPFDIHRARRELVTHVLANDV